MHGNMHGVLLKPDESAALCLWGLAVSLYMVCIRDLSPAICRADIHSWVGSAWRHGDETHLD